MKTSWLPLSPSTHRKLTSYTFHKTTFLDRLFRPFLNCEYYLFYVNSFSTKLLSVTTRKEKKITREKVFFQKKGQWTKQIINYNNWFKAFFYELKSFVVSFCWVWFLLCAQHAIEAFVQHKLIKIKLETYYNFFTLTSLFSFNFFFFLSFFSLLQLPNNVIQCDNRTKK